MNKLENVAIAMHCNSRQLDGTPRQSFCALTDTSTMPLNLKSVNLSVPVLKRFTSDNLRYSVTLTFNLATLTFDL